MLSPDRVEAQTQLKKQCHASNPDNSCVTDDV